MNNETIIDDTTLFREHMRKRRIYKEQFNTILWYAMMTVAALITVLAVLAYTLPE